MSTPEVGSLCLLPSSHARAAVTSAERQVFLEGGPRVYSEVSIRFTTIEALEDALPHEDYRRQPIPWAAAFLAGKAFLTYRRNQGTKSTTLPDFLIGAHAAIAELKILTRDASHYRTYFPTVSLIAPSD